MGIFNLDRDTTKCRIVFLSNLCENSSKSNPVISHNQAMWAGPCLNQKISTSLFQIRFDKYLMCFDLKKAFQQIALEETDQNKLLFFWFKNLNMGDFTCIAYRNLRLSFGLRCSPTILMVGLFKILILDARVDPIELRNLKKLIYSLLYMDNGAFTANDQESLRWGFQKLNEIFHPYKFALQQFVTNDETLQSDIDHKLEIETPKVVKLFGLNWDRITDKISTCKLKLDPEADNKRLVLKSIALNFDPYNFNGPILNRARLFMHSLQTDKSLSWDKKLSYRQQKEWNNICKQVNATPEIEIQRFVGERNSSYRLIAFTDSSKSIYGTTVFIQDISTLEVNFVLAKNRLVNRQLENKSIPSLELQAVVLGTETLTDLCQEITGPQCPTPIKITELVLYTDSMVSLSWINGYVNTLDKMNKKSVFILNRLELLQRLCNKHPVKFSFISGILNPADCITRCISYKVLKRTNYFSGPKFLRTEISEEIGNNDNFDVIVPNPMAGQKVTNYSLNTSDTTNVSLSIQSEHLIDLNEVSKFSKLNKIHMLVLKFIWNLKERIRARKNLSSDSRPNLYLKAFNIVIKK
ncbi:uncharacterized protein LOC135208434 isoform X1 [Macrobrachium nipponense]|uniref:uncharacterized protein LOC135208434 isoform X1 n=1 Tax=Macrobrachium nipponense TaxID=159736 RepID=UPI0030C7A178